MNIINTANVDGCQEKNYIKDKTKPNKNTKKDIQKQ